MVNSLTLKEWNNWQDMCLKLKEAGAVTDDDLTSAVPEMETPGRQLLAAIREWGDSLVALRKNA